MNEIETLWVNGEITNNGVRNALKARNALRLFDKALVYYNTTNLSWKKCIKKAKEENILPETCRDL